MKREELAAQLPKNVALPKDRYSIQCTEEEFGESSKGNMMITRTWEVVDPTEKVINGQKYGIGGIILKQYLTTVCFKDGPNGKEVDTTKTQTMMAQVFEDYKKLGLPYDDIDENNPVLGAKGLVANAILLSKPVPQTKDPTPEQLAKGQKYGDPILDEEGKGLDTWRVQLDYNGLLGLSQSVKAVALP